MHKDNKRPDRSRLNKSRPGKPRGNDGRSFGRSDNMSRTDKNQMDKDQTDKDKSERGGKPKRDKRERSFSGGPGGGRSKPYKERSWAERASGRPGEGRRLSEPGRGLGQKPEHDREYRPGNGIGRPAFSRKALPNDKRREGEGWRGQNSCFNGKPAGGSPRKPKPFAGEGDGKKPFFQRSKIRPMKAEYSDDSHSRQNKYEESSGQGFSAFKSKYAQTVVYDAEKSRSPGHKRSRGHDEHKHDPAHGRGDEHVKELRDRAVGGRELKLDLNSPHDAEYFSEKQGNDAEGEEGVLLFGPRAVLDILEAAPAKVDSVFVLKGRRRPDNERILDLCRKSGARFSLVDEKALDRLVQSGNGGEGGRFRGAGHVPRHQGVVARLFQPGFLEFDALLAQTMDAPLPLLVALDQVQDPGNVGTLARTIFALGGAGLILPRHNGVFLGYAALKASAGALAQLPVARVSNLKIALKEAADQGFAIYGASCSENAGSVFKANLRLPAVLALGGEEKGLRESVEAQCQALLSVPMLREMDSLNVAQSGAIIAAQFLAGKLAGDKS